MTNNMVSSEYKNMKNYNRLYNKFNNNFNN